MPHDPHRTADDGASAVEYGLLAAALAAVVVLIALSLGGMIRDAVRTPCEPAGCAPPAGSPSG